MRTKKCRHLLAFFFDDLATLGEDFIHTAHASGCEFLALDVPSLRLFSDYGYPMSMIDDWVTPSQIARCNDQAASCQKNWYEVARTGFTHENVCWPEVDNEAMSYFWADAMLAMQFASNVRSRGVTALHFARLSSARPAIYYQRSDIFFHVCKRLLPSRTLSHPSRRFGIITAADFLRNNLGPYLRSAFDAFLPSTSRRPHLRGGRPYRTPSTTEVLGKVLLAFNIGEQVRFQSVIDELRASFSDRLACACFPPNHPHLSELEKATGTSVIGWPPNSSSPRRLLQVKFLRAYNRAALNSHGKPWELPLRSLAFHFFHYCISRWPLLCQHYALWKTLFRDQRLALVITSTLADAESQLPTLAAAHLGIPTISVPHSGSVVRPEPLRADKVFVSLQLHDLAYQRMGFSRSRRVLCRGLLPPEQYSTTDQMPSWDANKCRILVISNTVIFRQCVSPFIVPTAQRTALNELARPPLAMQKQVELLFKLHPLYSDHELFKLVDSMLLSRIIPSATPLSSCLQEADLVVALNYCGTALVHAMSAAKPVVLLWNDPLIGRGAPFPYADLFTGIGKLIVQPKDFWPFVKKFVRSASLRDQLAQQVDAFMRANYEVLESPSFCEAVRASLQEI